MLLVTKFLHHLPNDRMKHDRLNLMAVHHEASGMASLTTGLCFLLAIPIAPVVSAVPPLASGPILCLLGALMCSSVRGINWDDFEDS